MKLFILGSTGPTGLQLVQQALDKDHEVVTVVRNPDKLSIQHAKLKVIKGSVINASDMTEPMRGCDAVVSALGGQNGTFNPCSIYTASGAAIVKAMRDSGVKRFIVCTAWATKDDRELPFVWRWVLRYMYIQNVLHNMSEFEDYLTLDCKDLNITIVRPGMLSNGPATGKQLNIAVDKYCAGGAWFMGDTISRADVATFMLGCLDTDVYDNKGVAIV